VLWLALAFVAVVVTGFFLRGRLVRFFGAYRVERGLLEIEEELRQMKERGEKPDITGTEKAELWARIRELQPGAVERLREAGLLEDLEPEGKKRAPN